MRRAAYRAPRRPSVLFAVVHGEIRADEFADELARLEAKRPLRVVIDLVDATSIEEEAILPLLRLKRRLTAQGVLVQVVAAGQLAAELAALESAHAVDEGDHAR